MKLSIENSPYYAPLVLALMLLGLLLLFGDFLFSGKMLYGSDTVQSELYHRTLFVENFNEQHKILQWDPYILGGIPYVDSFQGDTFYPFSILKFFLPLYYQLGLNLVLHIFFAGIFMFLSAREFGLNKTASLFSGASYMFAAYLISMVASGHDGNISVATLFPLVMLFMHRGFRSMRFFDFSLLGLILGLIILAPHPRLSYFTIWAVGLYAVFNVAVLYFTNRKLRTMIKPVLLISYSVVLALLISAIQFYPGFVYTNEHSVRATMEDNWYWATSWSLHEEDVLSQLIPEFSGFTLSGDKRGNYWGKNAFKYSTETVGVVPLFLALIGFFFRKRKEAYFFGGLAVFAFIYALGATTPAFELFYKLIPKVNSLRAPAMIMFLFSFSIALLAGMGIQSVFDLKTKSNFKPGKRLKFMLLSAPILMLALALAFSLAGTKVIETWVDLFYPEAVTLKAESGLTLKFTAILNLPFVQSGTWVGFALVTTCSVLIYTYLRINARPWLLSMLVLIPVVDGVRFNSKFISTVDPYQYTNPNSTAQFFIDRPGYYRVYDMSPNFNSSYLTQFGIELVEAFHRNKMLTFEKLLESQRNSNSYSPQFVNLIGVKYMLVPKGRDFHTQYFAPNPLINENPGTYYTFVRNDNAFERAYLANSYKIYSDYDQIIDEVIKGQIDLRRTVLLEEQPKIQIPAYELANDSAWIIDRSSDSVVVGVTCSANRILALIENYYDSWRVSVDGQPAKLLRAYGSFRAVEVPEGAKKILFKYKSDKYEFGKWVSISACFYLFMIFAFNFFARRRFSPASGSK